ncbi:MAG: D-glycerate dehydrogenase [Ignavibacteriaceae bacterium]|nr:D-glycerate dehydrogenase [Ignavibacteria bacterium]NNJ53517.1 D-glycerate dehydrogenase [Ignavibacteriaceae bacterium]NNL19919.1 D-glycerate dehydrogenase [Ignavibacteriaceae bacterium]
MKVFITRELPEVAFTQLSKNNIPFDYYKADKPIPRSVLLKNVKGCTALISLLTEKIDKILINTMPDCKIIANYAVGYNNIDVDYAKKQKIIVTNTPDVLTDSTADLTIALLLACARRLSEGEMMIHAGEYKGWKPKLLLGTELKGKSFGILGAGRIGTAVAKRAMGFGVKILYTDRSKNEQIEKITGAKKVSDVTLLKKSDFISIHLPLNKYTFHYLNSKRLSLLKKESILINTARGEIIDETALIKMLKKGKLKAVGLDVFENEPSVNKELLKFNNVLVLPHLGSASVEARNAMAELAVENVINVLRGKRPITPVI